MCGCALRSAGMPWVAQRVCAMPKLPRVDRLIMATLHNGDPLIDADAAYMVDIDLSSFGLSWAEFMRDSENLRRENSSLSGTEYY